VSKFWVKIPVNKKNFSSLKITNMKFTFEPCIQLDLEVRGKRPNIKSDHLIVTMFGVKKFIIQSTQKKKNLMFECYKLQDPIE
jgi:hypothetical protein